MLAKNRQSSKLNPEQVREIRKIYKHGGITQKQIAEQYNVSRHTITDLLDGTTWKHVKDEDN
jgi:DNA-binding transcriptional regulator LsrR (DeoR family)